MKKQFIILLTYLFFTQTTYAQLAQDDWMYDFYEVDTGNSLRVGGSLDRIVLNVIKNNLNAKQDFSVANTNSVK